MMKYLAIAAIVLSVVSCKTPSTAERQSNLKLPEQYSTSSDTVNTAKEKWSAYFSDTNLKTLIETALANNQELNIAMQEIEIARNEVKTRKGEYLPFVGLRGGAGVDKVGRYTSKGANDATTEIKPGVETPEPLQDYMVGAYATWEVDVWGKLRNAKKSAISRYLASVEGRNFMVTNLISEIADSYYELIALDNQLEIVNQNIAIQNNAFEVVKLQKEAARVNELAVRRFQAQVLDTKSLQFNILQKITETENRINFLVGRFPQHVDRDASTFFAFNPKEVHIGIPAQLLENRPDIKQAELELQATKFDVKSAKARFYPSLGISAGVGFQAFKPSYLFTTPESLLYNVVGDLAAPLLNRNAIKASFNTANAKQIQAVYEYEKVLLNAYVEVSNLQNKIENSRKAFELKAQQVEAMNQSVTIANDLFKSTRADYMEVLLTQRDALESKFDLVETKMQQINAMIAVYRALGGGWK
ncbi:TolC family protein [Flavobacterium sp.]|uniref:TolC family protein n=1 Tax=Flavobacterium sp. TaxID=239 RepID=UPI0039196B2D